MKTPKESPLAVLHSLPEPPLYRQKAELVKDEFGYLFIKYTGERESVSFDPQAITDLLKAFPLVYLQDEEGNRIEGNPPPPTPDPSKIMALINRYGVIGLSDIDYRNEIITKRSKVDIANLTRLNLQKAEKFFKDGVLNKRFIPRLLAIREGSEFPYSRAVEILEEISRAVRLYLNLLEDKKFESNKVWELNDRNRKRIVSAWNRLGGSFREDEDPGDPKFGTRAEWGYRFGNDKVGSLDFAEAALSSFALVLNKFLEPVSRTVVSTEGIYKFNRLGSSLETSLAYELVRNLADRRVKKICVVCSYPYLPKRDKEDNKYCGESCSKKIRNRNYRAKKKVSASKAGSKTTTRKGKEKKSEPTKNGRAKGRNR